MKCASYILYGIFHFTVPNDALMCFFWSCPLLQHLHSPSVWTLCFSVCLFKTPFQKTPVWLTDWSALTGLSRHCPLCICIISLWVERFDSSTVFIWHLDPLYNCKNWHRNLHLYNVGSLHVYCAFFILRIWCFMSANVWINLSYMLLNL